MFVMLGTFADNITLGLWRAQTRLLAIHRQEELQRSKQTCMVF
jgi:hypothetical protein